MILTILYIDNNMSIYILKSLKLTKNNYLKNTYIQGLKKYGNIH